MTNLTILTRVKKDAGHQKTKLSIDWAGMGRDELILLAQARICQRLQWQWTHDGHVPAEFHAVATDFVQPDAATVDFTKYKQPKAAISDDWQSLLDALPRDEKEQLIKQLEAMG